MRTATIHHMTPKTDLTMLNAWAGQLAGHHSPATIRHRTEFLARLAAKHDCSPEELRVEHVADVLGRIELAASSRATYYATFKAWFEWLQTAGVILDSPLAEFRRPRARRRDVRVLRADHVEHLLSSGIRSRTRAMVLLAAYQGFRVSEIARVSGDDIDRRGGTIDVLGKGGVQAILPLHPVIADLADQMPAGWWFPQRRAHRDSPAGGHVLGSSVSGVLSVAMKRSGIPGSAHALRHWFASEMLRRGVNLRVIQQLMRHASMATTQMYLHVDDEQRRAGVLSLPDLRPGQLRTFARARPSAAPGIASSSSTVSADAMPRPTAA